MPFCRVAFALEQLLGLAPGVGLVVYQAQLLHALGCALGGLPAGGGAGDFIGQLLFRVVPVFQQVQGFFVGPAGVGGQNQLAERLVSDLVPGPET